MKFKQKYQQALDAACDLIVAITADALDEIVGESYVRINLKRSLKDVNLAVGELLEDRE